MYYKECECLMILIKRTNKLLKKYINRSLHQTNVQNICKSNKQIVWNSIQFDICNKYNYSENHQCHYSLAISSFVSSATVVCKSPSSRTQMQQHLFKNTPTNANLLLFKAVVTAQLKIIVFSIKIYRNACKGVYKCFTYFK